MHALIVIFNDFRQFFIMSVKNLKNKKRYDETIKLFGKLNKKQIKLIYYKILTVYEIYKAKRLYYFCIKKQQVRNITV